MVLVFVFSFIALLTSKWLLSVSLILLIPLAILVIFQQQHKEYSWKKVVGDRLRFFLSFPPYWGFSLIFFVILFSGILFGTSEYWEDRLRIKLPMLIAPLLFAILPPLPKKYYKTWAIAVVSIAAISLCLILANYILDYDVIKQSISKGGNIPTPISHIRYSVFVAFGMVLSIWLAIDQDSFLGKSFRIPGIILALLLFIGLHILSVRSGLIAAYIGIAVCMGHWTIKNKKWLFGICLFLVLSVSPYLAYQNIDSFKSKIDYSLHDFKMYKSRNGQSYSDGDRLLSMKIGWSLFKANPIMGTGIGNFSEEVKGEYEKNYAEQQPKMPHNQFLSIMASTGLVGLGISLFGLFLPLFYRRQYTHLPMLSFYLMMISSMLVENTIETSVGLTLFLLPILIMSNYLIGQKS